MIQVFAEIVCPFTHVGLRRLIEARGVRGLDLPLRVRAWPLEFVNGHPSDPDMVAREIEALRENVAPELFQRFDRARLPRTSIPAFGLAAAAYRLSDPVGEAVSVDLRGALFEDGLDVADAEVLDAIARRYDVEALDSHAVLESVRSDWQEGKARGVQGSPHFFIGERDWFCPTLDISESAGQYSVRTNATKLNEFYAAVFP
jgi:predicted DsbA family dithiol-disulfide isomerase